MESLRLQMIWSAEELSYVNALRLVPSKLPTPVVWDIMQDIIEDTVCSVIPSMKIKSGQRWLLDNRVEYVKKSYVFQTQNTEKRRRMSCSRVARSQ